FIRQELHKHVLLNLKPHERHYLTEIHFKNLLQQLWWNDWYLYPYPIYRVYLSALLKLCMYSSGRVGEYVESTARLGSGRGLHVPQVCHSFRSPSLIKLEGLSRVKRPSPPTVFQLQQMRLSLQLIFPVCSCLALDQGKDRNIVAMAMRRVTKSMSFPNLNRQSCHVLLGIGAHHVTAKKAIHLAQVVT
ncbi:hypothetical protein ACJ73_08999, partial [Blastomyces percursus]